MSDTYDIDEGLAEEPEVLTLPLDAWHRAHGGRMVEFAGYWMPVQYEGIIAEHLCAELVMRFQVGLPLSAEETKFLQQKECKK